MAKAKTLELRFPSAGVARRISFHESAQLRPPYPTPWATNCRPEDPLASRLRGGSRPGLTLYADDLDGGVIDAILSVPIATASGVASKLAVVADDVLGVFDGGVYIAPTGDLLTEAGVEITTEADVNILVDTGGVPGACFLCARGQKVYAVASAGIVSLDLITGVVDSLTATAGTTPTGMTLGCVYRDRLVVAGADNAVYMSRQGDFADWDFGADVEDSGRAVAFQLGEAAEHGALCTAVVPFKDASLLLATEYGLWVVNGDPAANGTLRNVSRGVGIIGSTAWCLVQDARLGDRFVKNGIVFLGRTGLFVVAPSGDGLKPVTEERIPEELIDVSLEAVSMVYSPDERGVYVFLTFDDLDAHVTAEIDNRSADTADLELFASAHANGGTNPWSTTCWVKDLDFSGVSPWNDAGDTSKAVTMVSPRHGLLANHHTLIVGDQVAFVNRIDGSECLRTIAGIEQVLTVDVDVCYLNADVDPGVTWYKVLPSDVSDYITLVGSPVVICDQEEKAFIGEIVSLNVTAAVVDRGTIQVMDIRQRSASAAGYFENVVVGDSGHPTFLVLDGELVIMGTHTGTNAAKTIWYDTRTRFYYPDINTSMSNLDTASTGYQLTTYDVSGLVAAQAGNHWFYDLARDGFWPIALQSDHEPLAAALHDGQVLLAGLDGTIRSIGGDDDYDSTGNDDIESHVLIGPLRAAAPGTFGRLMNLRASIAASSGAVRWRIVTGETAEEACANGKLAIEAFQAGTSYSTYVAATGGLVAGRNGIAYPRTRAEWFVVWLESTAKWGYETMMIETEQSGKVR